MVLGTTMSRAAIPCRASLSRQKHLKEALRAAAVRLGLKQLPCWWGLISVPTDGEQRDAKD